MSSAKTAEREVLMLSRFLALALCRGFEVVLAIAVLSAGQWLASAA
jgi:hypothetical protein